jgi:galactosyl transferase GMA12/MNN10 family
MAGTDVRAVGGSATNGAIVTAAGPAMHDALHDLALPTFRTYAQAWGWKVLAHDLFTDGSGADIAATQAKWAKLELLREALRHHPLALWLDADVLLLRHDDDIRQHLHPESFQALVLEHVPAEHRVNPNTGVWLLRSCPAAFAFLDAVQNCGLQPGPWADQGAVLVALGWDRGDETYRWARPGPGNAFTAGTSWLPPGWNQPYLEERLDSDQYNGTAASYVGRPNVADPQALHFMGMLPGARYQHMARTYISRVGTKAVA